MKLKQVNWSNRLAIAALVTSCIMLSATPSAVSAKTTWCKRVINTTLRGWIYIPFNAKPPTGWYLATVPQNYRHISVFDSCKPRK